MKEEILMFLFFLISLDSIDSFFVLFCFIFLCFIFPDFVIFCGVFLQTHDTRTQHTDNIDLVLYGGRFKHD